MVFATIDDCDSCQLLIVTTNKWTTPTLKTWITLTLVLIATKVEMILQALEYESGKSQSLSFLKSRVLVITLTIHPKKSESTFDHCGRTRESARRVFHINSRYRTHLISSFRFTVLDLKPKSSGDLIKIPLLLLLQMQASFKPKLGRAGLLRSTPGEDPK